LLGILKSKHHHLILDVGTAILVHERDGVSIGALALRAKELLSPRHVFQSEPCFSFGGHREFCTPATDALTLTVVTVK
jgi:hypothetical protein